MSNPDHGSEPFGESHHHFLASTRNKAIAAGLAVVIAAGAGAGWVKDKVQDFQDGRTLVENKYFSTEMSPYTDSSDLTTQPVVTVTELNQLKTEDEKAAAKEEAAFETTMTGFYDGLDFFRELNTNGTKAFEDTNEKIDFAEDLTKSLNSIMDATDDDDEARDGVELFNEIVADDIQKLIKQAGIKLEYAKPNDKFEVGSSIVVGIFDESKTTSIIIQFVPDYAPKVPEITIPPAVNPGTPTQMDKLQVRIYEIKEIMKQALQGRKEQVAQKRLVALLEEHPDLRPIHEKHVSVYQHPKANGLYSPLQELGALNQILEDRKNRALDRQRAKEAYPAPPTLVTPKKKPNGKIPTPQHPTDSPNIIDSPNDSPR